MKFLSIKILGNIIAILGCYIRIILGKELLGATMIVFSFFLNNNPYYNNKRNNLWFSRFLVLNCKITNCFFCYNQDCCCSWIHGRRWGGGTGGHVPPPTFRKVGDRVSFVPPTFWMIFIGSMFYNWLINEIRIIFSDIMNYNKYESIKIFSYFQ